MTIPDRIPLFLAALLVALILAAGCTSMQVPHAPPTAAPTTIPATPGVTETHPSTPGTTISPTAVAPVTFGIPKKSAHYESNTPAHGQRLAGVPINVVINFNFDLHRKSSIEIMHEGKDYGIGPTVVDGNGLTLRRDMDPSAPDGLYTVVYNACWPDGSCHDGSFQFAVDRTLQDRFADLRNQSEVPVSMVDITFTPALIIISPGTNVTWVNEDTVQHTVNTDTHPAHTYYPPQNSRLLENGESFSVIFTKEGIYPYHCSVHPEMIGMILVMSK